ncbi:MAG: hypothetical protein BGP10_15880 [Rhodanobacter sp. 68-29]|nr:hypothetical protein [Rhodanobacter sp.]ODV27876.1 MAG: hypothetical protein ABT19_01450 [Rhodanobacter sp. SCN 68-63]OJY61385.1 MAG: hypothetical protein BGP10_15880 [Rhodanobacter sp. 68-29]
MKTDNLKRCIVRAATECEECLRLADFAEREPSLSGGMADSLRKMAAYHSDNAFLWARRLHAVESHA